MIFPIRDDRVGNAPGLPLVMGRTHQINGRANQERSVVPIDTANRGADAPANQTVGHLRIKDTRPFDTAENDDQAVPTTALGIDPFKKGGIATGMGQLGEDAVGQVDQTADKGNEMGECIDDQNCRAGAVPNVRFP